MGEPIRHHYIPRFFLSAWCSPGAAPGEGSQLWVVENSGGDISFFRRAPKAVGFQTRLYSFSEDLPIVERAALETTVFQVLDDKGKSLVTKLMAGHRLDPVERGVWAMFVAGMRLRTPENIARLKEVGGDHVKQELGKGQGEYEALKEEGDPETFLEWIESKAPGLTQNFSLASVPRVLAGEVAGKINKMAWYSPHFGNGRHRLLCSDRPCVFTAGIDDPDCVIALPLSPTHAFLAFYPGSRAEAALIQHGASVIGAALNKNVVTQAKERAFCHGKHDAPKSFFEKYLSASPA